MVMATATDSGDRHMDDPKSPWRKPSSSNVDSPVLGPAASWPALSDAPPSISVKQPSDPDHKGSDAHQHAPGYRNYHNRHQKYSSIRRNNAPYNEPLERFSQQTPLMYPPMMPPMPPAMLPSYQYPPVPFPFPPPAGPKMKTQPIDNTNSQVRRNPFMQEAWQNQRPIYPGVRPHGFVRPFFGPPTAFIVGSRVPGAPPMYFVPAPPPPGSVMLPHPPHFMQHPTAPASPQKTPEATDLKTRILKQIEYYFR